MGLRAVAASRAVPVLDLVGQGGGSVLDHACLDAKSPVWLVRREKGGQEDEPGLVALIAAILGLTLDLEE